MEDSSEEVSYHSNTDIERGQDQDKNAQPNPIPKNKLESRSMLMMKKLSTQSLIDEEDDDLSEDDSVKTLVSRPIEKRVYVDKTVNWSQWRKIASRIYRWSIPAVISLIISVFCKFVLSQFICYGLALWIWTGLPFVVIVTDNICDTVEFLLLCLISYALQDKSWNIRGFIASFRRFFGVIAFCVIINSLIFPTMKLADPDSITKSGDDVLDKILLVISVIPLWCWFLVVRDVIYLAIKLRITSESYKHAINDLGFMENVSDRLCATSISQALKIRGQLQRNTHIMDRVDSVINGNMKFPLQCHEDSVWSRSSTHEVTITTEREMVVVALIVFDNFLVTAGSETVPFDHWSRYFSNSAEAGRAFQLFFSNECWARQCFDETEFAKSFVRLFQRRNQLKDQLRKFENTAKLLLNIADIPYFLLFILTVALLAGLSLSVVAVSCSALVVSFSFALGPSIERIVSSISFIFGSKPYEVNDLVEINGVVYRVHTLNLMQTTFKAQSGKLCMIHHSVLRTDRIINLSRSTNASATIEIEIDIKTSRDKIERLRKFVRKLAAKDSFHWRPNVQFRYRRPAVPGVAPSPPGRQILVINVTSTLPWRTLDAFRDAEFELRSKILDKLQHLQIE